MILLGDYNTLDILRVTEPGIFLGDKDGNEVLLPNRYIPETFEIGDQINVFVYLDNDERPVAVTDQPYITKGNFALLRCNDVNKHGAFLDWGLVKELFCPFKEQAFKMQSLDCTSSLIRPISCAGEKCGSSCLRVASILASCHAQAY